MKIKASVMAGAVAGVLVVLGCVGAANAATNLISDGDFSAPNTQGSWGLYSNGQVGGWNNLNNDVLEVGNSTIYGLSCHNTACQSLEVNANTFDTVGQTVTGLTVGQWYALSWDYGGRPGGGVQALDVSFGSAPVFTNTDSIGVWTANAFRVKANATSELLQFSSKDLGGLPSYGNVITNVSLSAVPEPASWLLMIGGLSLMGAVLRRRGAVVAA